MKLSHTKVAAARRTLLVAGACVQWAAFAADGTGGTWRCGNTYTDQPCKGGRALDLDDARSADQKRVADDSAREAGAAAERMERDRLRLEARHARRAPILIDDKSRETRKAPSPRDEAVVLKHKKKTKDPVYLSTPGADAAPKKRSRKAGGRKTGE